jgi:hypothetical protein
MYTEAYPLGPQTVKMTLPAGFKVSGVHLLAAGTKLSVTRSGNAIEFAVPGIEEYEVATIV